MIDKRSAAHRPLQLDGLAEAVGASLISTAQFPIGQIWIRCFSDIARNAMRDDYRAKLAKIYGPQAPDEFKDVRKFAETGNFPSR
jgi:hypothetical protein